jgi:DNA processing protein
MVIEARERSGALITADFALEEGRDVLAARGERTSTLSAGTNALLRLGATPVTCTADVLEGFGIESAIAERAPVGLVADALLARLGEGALTADELFRSAAIDPGEGSAALIELELAGRVTLEDGVYRAAV